MYIYIIYAYIVLLRCNLRQEDMYICSPIFANIPDISPSLINFPGRCSRCGHHLEHCREWKLKNSFVSKHINWVNG